MADPTKTRFGIPEDQLLNDPTVMTPLGGNPLPATEMLGQGMMPNAPVMDLPGGPAALPQAPQSAPAMDTWQQGPQANPGVGAPEMAPPRTLEEATQQALNQAALDPTKLSPAQLALLDQGRGQQQAQGSSSSSTSRTGYADPAAVARERDAITATADQRGRQAAELGAIQTGVAGEIADKQGKLASDLAAQTAERRHIQQEQEIEFGKFVTSQEKATQEYVKQANSIDPSRLVRGKEWMVGLAAALGAYGAALTKGPNTAAMMIESALDRDLQAQKTALGAKRDSISIAQQAYSEKRAAFQDRAAALGATKADMMDIAAAQIRQSAARREGAEAKSLAETQANEVAMRAQQLRLSSYEQEKVTRSTTSSSAATQPKGTALDAILKQAQTKTAIDKAYLGDEKETPQNRTQFKETMAAMAAAGAATQDLKEYRKQLGETSALGRAFPTNQTEHQVGSVQTRLIRNTGMAQNKGSFSEADVKSAQDQFTSGAWTSESLAQKADASLQGALNKVWQEVQTLPPEMRPEAERRAVGVFGQAGWDSIKAGKTIPDGAAQHGALGGVAR